jgi:geranylgeranyl diphosphate synthase, type I
VWWPTTSCAPYPTSPTGPPWTTGSSSTSCARCSSPRVSAPLVPDPTEVDDVRWTTWTDLVERAARTPHRSARGRCCRSTGWPSSANTRLISMHGPGRVHRSTTRRVRSWSRAAIRSKRLGRRRPPPLDVRRRTLRRARRLRPAGVRADERGRRAARSRRQAAPPGVRPLGLPGGGGGGADIRQSTAAAAAVELLHTFAIIHDDVMDGAVTRRRRPAVHVELGRLRHGELPPRLADRFGESAAVLAGDLAFAWAHEMLGSIDAEPDRHEHTRCVRAACSRPCAPRPWSASTWTSASHARTRATCRRARSPCSSRAGTPSPARSSSAPPSVARTTRRSNAPPLRRRRRCGVPAARRRARRVRRRRGHRQELLDDLRDGKASLLMVRARQLAPAAGRRVLDEHVGDEDARRGAGRAVPRGDRRLRRAGVGRTPDRRPRRVGAAHRRRRSPTNVRDALTALALAATTRHA